MRVMQGTVYCGYTYILNPIESNGGFLDAFSVHEHKDGTHEDLRITAFQRSASQATVYDSREQAMSHAEALAKSWIDAHQ